jgi:hypothetical protein
MSAIAVRTGKTLFRCFVSHGRGNISSHLHQGLFELASLLVRFDHVASFIVNANQSIM